MEISEDKLSKTVNIENVISFLISACNIGDARFSFKNTIFKYILKNYETIPALQRYMIRFDHSFDHK